MACTEVGSLEDLPPGMFGKVVPAGRYAVFTHKGTLDKLEHTMNVHLRFVAAEVRIRTTRGSRSGGLRFRFKFGSDDSILEIHIPVK
jgi:AraC family transcriptional regulator